MPAAQREMALLDVAIEQVVWPLVGLQRRELERARELEMAGVADADGARLPLLLNPAQPLELPFPAIAGFMQLRHVHVVGTEARKRGLERCTGVIARTDLGGDRDALPARAECAAE